MANKGFDVYFAGKTLLAGQQAPTGDDFLVQRSGTVFRSTVVYNQAFASVTDDATETLTTTTDAWVPLANTLQNSILNPTFTWASNQFTYIGPNQIYPNLISAGVSLTKVKPGAKSYEVGIFINDILVSNGMRVTVTDTEWAYVEAKVSRTLTQGDVIDVRVRARTGTDELTVSACQFNVS